MNNLIKSTLLTLAVVLTALPAAAQRGQRGNDEAMAFWKKQHEENQAFHRTLKGKEPPEALAAIKEHRNTQFKENLAFVAERKEARIARINSREHLTDDQKAQLLSFVEVMYGKRVDFHTRQHEKLIALLDKLAAQKDLTLKAIAEALKAYHAEAREDMEEFRKEQRQAWREKIREVVGERKRKAA